MIATLVLLVFFSTIGYACGGLFGVLLAWIVFGYTIGGLSDLPWTSQR